MAMGSIDPCRGNGCSTRKNTEHPLTSMNSIYKFLEDLCPLPYLMRQRVKAHNSVSPEAQPSRQAASCPASSKSARNAEETLCCSQCVDQNLDGIDLCSLQSALGSSQILSDTVRLLAQPRCHADKLVLVLQGKSQLRLSASSK